jgi:hypothetical protein
VNTVKFHFSSLSPLEKPQLLSPPAKTPSSRRFLIPDAYILPISADLVVLDDSGVETLGVLDVDSLYVRVQLLLCALLVVTLSGDADTESVWDALDSGLPDLLVQLGVETDILGALHETVSDTSFNQNSAPQYKH